MDSSRQSAVHECWPALGHRFLLGGEQQNRLRRISDLSDYPLVNIDLLRKSCREHLQILDAVEENKLEVAAKHMHAHLSRASDILERRVMGDLDALGE